MFMGKSTISMAIFNCYVSSPEGIPKRPKDILPQKKILLVVKMGPDSTGQSSLLVRIAIGYTPVSDTPEHHVLVVRNPYYIP